MLERQVERKNDHLNVAQVDLGMKYLALDSHLVSHDYLRHHLHITVVCGEVIQLDVDRKGRRMMR